MSKVIAIREVRDGVIYSYGEGLLIENQIPDLDPFKGMMMENPCIKLDTGKLVWGFECWWGTIEQMKKKFGDLSKAEMVEPNDVQPLKIKSS